MQAHPFYGTPRKPLPERPIQRTSPARATECVLEFPIGELLHQQITDCRKLQDVHRSFLALGNQKDEHGSGLSCEGFRKTLQSGRLAINDLPRLFEAMALNGVDPCQSLAAIESACLPRDPDLDGNLSSELADLATITGDIAVQYRNTGDSLAGYSNPQRRYVMSIAARTIAAGRRLYREALEAYAC